MHLGYLNVHYIRADYRTGQFTTCLHHMPQKYTWSPQSTEMAAIELSHASIFARPSFALE